MNNRFVVCGVPAPGGSKNPIPIPDPNGPYVRVKDRRRVRIVLADAGGVRNKEWRRRALAACRAAWVGAPLDCPCGFVVEFRMPRPKHHYRTGRFADQLKPDAPEYHTSDPDLTKLIRSTEDSLKGVAWRDDSAVVYQRASKRYANRPEDEGATIEVFPIYGIDDPIADPGNT